MISEHAPLSSCPFKIIVPVFLFVVFFCCYLTEPALVVTVLTDQIMAEMQELLGPGPDRIVELSNKVFGSFWSCKKDLVLFDLFKRVFGSFLSFSKGILFLLIFSKSCELKYSGQIWYSDHWIFVFWEFYYWLFQTTWGGGGQCICEVFETP